MLGEVAEPRVAEFATWSRAMGEEVPTPTLPVDLTTNREVALEEAMFKMSLVEPLVPWRLKEMVEEVAPMPTTVPLSRMVEVARVVLFSHLVA
jgi:hypothetical protein